MLQSLLLELKSKSDIQRAELLASFFKTSKGGYGEGDKFLGIVVPAQRMLAKRYKDLSLSEVEKLLQSGFHEQRLTALFILRIQYQKANELQKEKIIKLYLNNLHFINNWDLVDSSAPYLLGEYLLSKKRNILYKLVKSKNIWERRIAIMSTFAFIKVKQFDDALSIAEILLRDQHDLIQKAAGWMLREVGNRDLKEETKFLDKHYKNMPRTMLRYAIEKFSTNLRDYYLKLD